MTNFFHVPDKEKEYQRYMVFVLTIIWSVVTAVIVSVGFFYFPHSWLRWLIFLCVSVFIAVSNLGLNYLGYTKTASWSLVIMLWLYITIPCYSAGGILALGIMSQMSVILTAGFLLGWRGGLGIGLLTICVDFGLAYMEVKGHLPSPVVVHDPISRWIGAVIPFGTILALQYYATNHLRSGLNALKYEVAKRKEAEKIKDQTVYNLGERVKELRTLYAVSRVLTDEKAAPEHLFSKIVDLLPYGWQYPDITAARISVAGVDYTTKNYRRSDDFQIAETATAKGTKIEIEVVYLKTMPNFDEGSFLSEERDLINMLAEMLKTDMDHRERSSELEDYKYALDLASIVAISDVDGHFTFVNDNFCKISKYTAEELIGKQHDILWSGYHTPEDFAEMEIAMRHGKTYRAEFCNKAKDGTLYWVDAAVIPFLNKQGKVYQYLSINHDITDRREAEEKIKQSEQLLRKVTSQIPGNTYMFEIDQSGHTTMIFSNRGTDDYNHSYDMDSIIENPGKIREIIHDEDKDKFNNAMKAAYQDRVAINVQYRILVNNNIRWRWMQAVPEKTTEGKMVWYGATTDITQLVDYIASIEQIVFDIGHVIRRPISSILGLTRLINDNDLQEKEIKEISRQLYPIAEEMDKFIRELNLDYYQRRQNTKFNIDISSFLDRRNSLFE